MIMLLMESCTCTHPLLIQLPCHFGKIISRICSTILELRTVAESVCQNYFCFTLDILFQMDLQACNHDFMRLEWSTYRQGFQLDSLVSDQQTFTRPLCWPGNLGSEVEGKKTVFAAAAATINYGMSQLLTNQQMMITCP